VAGSHEVVVSKTTLNFSAAHFLTLKGHICERLHGHNYRVGATVRGRLDPATGFVVDFAVLKQALRGAIERMDHRLLLPTRNPALTIREHGDRVEVDYLRPQWLVAPAAHVCRVAVVHTTAECLAEALAREVWQVVETAATVEELQLEVEESRGQSARYRIERGGGPG